MIGSLILLVTMATAEPTPISFRCDNMEVTQNPARSHCRGNAIARQENILICCEAFVTKADKDWQWQSLHCVGNVRAKRGEELAWANEAIFKVNEGLLTLEGNPILQRGKSLMRGEQIIIENKRNKASILKPTGIMHHTPAKKTPSLSKTSDALPGTCPLPPRPTKVVK
jgi:lipopolysaccharide transport protein LptA